MNLKLEYTWKIDMSRPYICIDAKLSISQLCANILASHASSLSNFCWWDHSTFFVAAEMNKNIIDLPSYGFTQLPSA